MGYSKTPNMKYWVSGAPPHSHIKVIPLETFQAEAMQRRGLKHIYDTAAQAFAVRDRLEKEKK